jgi:DNA repair exonuclease SbcCD nuclease subunit
MPKFLITGDWHLRATKPRFRIDKYVETQNRKISWIFETAKEYGCEAILQPGDLFDSFDVPNKLKIELIKKFKEYTDIPIITVFGQHDLKYRNYADTVLSLFREVDVVNPLALGVRLYIGKDEEVCVYGSGWDDSVPTPDSGVFNILLTHEMIVGNGVLWYGQEDYIEAKDALKKWEGFDLIVSGDNHQAFNYKSADRMLLNCGSLMRTTIAQRDHQPVVWIYNTDTKSAECLKVPIEPIEEVMDLELADVVKIRNKKMEEYKGQLSVDYEVELDFEKNVFDIGKANKVRKSTKLVMQNIFKQYYVEANQ